MNSAPVRSAVSTGTLSENLPAAQLAKVLQNYTRVMTCPASVHWRTEHSL